MTVSNIYSDTKKTKKKSKQNTLKQNNTFRRNKKGGAWWSIGQSKTDAVPQALQKKQKTKTKIVKRIDSNRLNYDDMNCQITSMELLQNTLDDYVQTFTAINNNNYSIFPYCSEHEKLGFGMDKVNRPKIDANVVDLLKTKFAANLVFNSPEIVNDTVNKLYVAPGMDVNNFIQYILNYTPMDNKKHVLLVSHSAYMTELSKFLCNNDCDGIQFDNLDIMQIIMDTTTKQIIYATIRRFDNNYKVSNPLNIPVIKDEHRSYFIMRHCVGCHNSVVNTHAGLFKKQTIKGYGEWAMCFKYNIDEMTHKKAGLLDVINYYGGINNFEFGSSIIFRSILTILLLYNVLTN